MMNTIQNLINKRLFTFTALIFLTIITAQNVNAQQTKELTTDEAEKWLSEAVKAELELSTAVSFTVVQHGKTIVSEAYGFADHTENKKYNTQHPALVGSISKLFIAASIAKLVKQQKIKSLDEPVKNHLKRLKLNNPFNTNVTFKHLLTHQAGLTKQNIFGRAFSTEHPAILDGQLLSLLVSDVTLEPGSTYVYSSQASAILAIAIEDITGIPIHAYLKANFFEPLGMKNTQLEYVKQPFSSLALGYLAKDSETPKKLGFFKYSDYLAPSTSLSSSTDDMAIFLKASLSGMIDNPEVREIHELFQTIQQPLDKEFNRKFGVGMAYSLHQEQNAFSDASTTIVSQGGLRRTNHTIVLLLPEHNIGIYVSLLGKKKHYRKPGIARKFGMKFLHDINIIESEPYMPVIDKNNSQSMHEDFSRLAGTYRYDSGMVNTRLGGPVNSLVNLLEGRITPQIVELVDLGKDELAINIGVDIYTAKYQTQLRCKHTGYNDLDCADSNGNSVFLNLQKKNGNTIIEQYTRLTPLMWLQTLLAKFETLKVLFILLSTGLFAIFWQKNSVSSPYRYLTIALGAFAALTILTIQVNIGKQFYGLVSEAFNMKPYRFYLLMIIINFLFLLSILFPIQTILRWIRPKGERGQPSIVTTIHSNLLMLVAILIIPALFYYQLLGFDWRLG